MIHYLMDSILLRQIIDDKFINNWRIEKEVSELFSPVFHDTIPFDQISFMILFHLIRQVFHDTIPFDQTSLQFHEGSKRETIQFHEGSKRETILPLPSMVPLMRIENCRLVWSNGIFLSCHYCCILSEFSQRCPITTGFSCNFY